MSIQCTIVTAGLFVVYKLCVHVLQQWCYMYSVLMSIKIVTVIG